MMKNDPAIINRFSWYPMSAFFKKSKLAPVDQLINKTNKRFTLILPYGFFVPGGGVPGGTGPSLSPSAILNLRMLLPYFVNDS